jgi:DNA-binding response OmpR family regulator
MKTLQKKILICDDDTGIVDVTSIVLQDAGYEIETCPHGDEVLATVRAFKPDLILMDLWMPGPGGETLTTHLKEKVRTKKIPVVIVSANKDTASIVKKIGADDYLCKPFDIVDLEKIVRKYTQ